MVTSSPRRSRPNYLYSIISVALVLFLLGFFGLLLLHGRQLVRVAKENVNILIELDDLITSQQVDQLEGYLQRAPFTKTGSVSFIDREAAAEMMQEAFGEDFLLLDLPNPFFDLFSFNVRSDYLQSDSLRTIRTALMAQPGVSEIYYQENLIEEVGGNLNRLAYIALALGVFFLFVATTLIHNTIRLALYSNRFLIKNMQLVGATWGFISRPYLWLSLSHGFFAGVLAIAGLTGFIFWIRAELPEISILQQPLQFFYLFTGLLLLGLVLYFFSTWLVVNKYLKMRVDDLY